VTAYFTAHGMIFGWAWFLANMIGILAIALPLMLAVAMVIYAERKIWAAIALRRGPNVVGPWGLLQSFADGLKVFLKETIVPSSANKGLFLIAPIITFATALIVWAVVPFDIGVVLTDINVGLEEFVEHSFYEKWDDYPFKTDPLGNPLSPNHPWNKTTIPRPGKQNWKDRYSWATTPTWLCLPSRGEDQTSVGAELHVQPAGAALAAPARSDRLHLVAHVLRGVRLRLRRNFSDRVRPENAEDRTQQRSEYAQNTNRFTGTRTYMEIRCSAPTRTLSSSSPSLCGRTYKHPATSTIRHARARPTLTTPRRCGQAHPGPVGNSGSVPGDHVGNINGPAQSHGGGHRRGTELRSAVPVT